MNTYKRVIEIFKDNENMDYRELVYKFASEYPNQFVELFVSKWEEEAKKMYNPNTKIQTIKFVRESSGMGLKEAKEWVEVYCQKIGYFDTLGNFCKY